MTRVQNVTDRTGIGRSLYTISITGAHIPNLELALSRSLATDSRLLVNRRRAGEEVDGGYSFDGVLPMRSSRHEVDVAALPETDIGRMSMMTPYFREPEGRTCYATVAVLDEGLHYTEDRNFRSFNRFDDAVMSTLVGYLPQKVWRRILPLSDPTGQGRRVYELRSSGGSRNLMIGTAIAVAATAIATVTDGRMPGHVRHRRRIHEPHLPLQRVHGPADRRVTVLNAERFGFPQLDGFRVS